LLASVFNNDEENHEDSEEHESMVNEAPKRMLGCPTVDHPLNQLEQFENPDTSCVSGKRA
jgi:hypothetical protein